MCCFASELVESCFSVLPRPEAWRPGPVPPSSRPAGCVSREGRVLIPLCHVSTAVPTVLLYCDGCFKNLRFM